MEKDHKQALKEIILQAYGIEERLLTLCPGDRVCVTFSVAVTALENHWSVHYSDGSRSRLFPSTELPF